MNKQTNVEQRMMNEKKDDEASVWSGTSPYLSHGEAQAAESQKDFVHKLRISLKELRETQRWLKLIQKVPLIKKPELLNDILEETEELIKIFVTSIKTAEKKKK